MKGIRIKKRLNAVPFGGVSDSEWIAVYLQGDKIKKEMIAASCDTHGGHKHFLKYLNRGV